jgi:hypothetical protein
LIKTTNSETAGVRCLDNMHVSWDIDFGYPEEIQLDDLEQLDEDKTSYDLGFYFWIVATAIIFGRHLFE